MLMLQAHAEGGGRIQDQQEINYAAARQLQA